MASIKKCSFEKLEGVVCGDIIISNHASECSTIRESDCMDIPEERDSDFVIPYALAESPKTRRETRVRGRGIEKKLSHNLPIIRECQN